MIDNTFSVCSGKKVSGGSGRAPSAIAGGVALPLGISKLTSIFPSLAAIKKSPLLRGYFYDCEAFCLYLLDKELKTINLHLRNSLSLEDFFVQFPYPHRWKNEYRSMLNAKLFQLTDSFEYDGIWSLLTLTVGGKLSLPLAFMTLRDSRHKLLEVLMKNTLMTDYFWVLEPHRSGWPHCHLMTPCDLRPLSDRLKSLWSDRYQVGSRFSGLDISVVDKGNSVVSLRNYLMSYLRPSTEIQFETPGDLAFNAIAWKLGREKTGIRFWGASTNFRNLMKREKTPSSNQWIETGIGFPKGEILWLVR